MSLRTIGVGAGKNLGVRRNLAWILPNMPEKYFKTSDLQKEPTSSSQFGRLSCQFGHFGRHYFQIKVCWTPFVLRCYKVLECGQRFCQDFMGFHQDFAKAKRLCVRLQPLHPVSFTSVEDN